MAVDPGELLKRLGGQTASQTSDDLPEMISEDVDIGSLVQKLRKQDPEFDYSGVKAPKLRFGLAAMDTTEEQEKFLENKVGKGGFARDRKGRLALTVEGLEKLGIENQGKPVIIDEPGLTMQDIIELGADAPAIIGGTLGAMAGAPGGPLIAAQTAGMGALAGRTVGEAIEDKLGVNIQEPREVARQAFAEVPLAAAGELGGQVLGAVGRKAMAPEASKVTQEALDLAQSARDIGAKPSVAQVTKAPILGRFQGMLNKIFGDPNAVKNSKALAAEMDRLKTSVGPPAKKGAVGDLIVSDIRSARQRLGKWAEDTYKLLDETIEGGAQIQTDRLKTSAAELVGNFPESTVTGQPILVKPELSTLVRQIDELPDSIPFAQMQRIRNRLFNAIGDDGLVPGLTGHDARQLYKAASKSFEDVVADPAQANEFRKLLGEINKTYSKNIKKFDDAYIERIVRDSGRGGAIDPELIVQTAFKKGRETQVKRLFKVIPEATKKKVRRAAMEDILSNFVEQTDDPLIQIFNGKKLNKVLGDYGEDTLDAMFGSKKAKELKKFADVSQFVSQKTGQSGGIVAAGIALHPWANLGRLLQLRLFSRLLNSEGGFKWLTEGISAPKTRAGSMALTRLTTQAIALRREAEQEEE